MVIIGGWEDWLLVVSAEFWGFVLQVLSRVIVGSSCCWVLIVVVLVCTVCVWEHWFDPII